MRAVQDVARLSLLVAVASGGRCVADCQDPFLTRVETAVAERDLSQLGALLAEAATKPVLGDFSAGARYFTAASHYAALLEGMPASAVDFVERLRPAYDCARHWAQAANAAECRYAAEHAAWLGSGLVDELRNRGAESEEVLQLADSIPIVAGQRNGVVACVQRADLRIELGRTGEAEELLRGISLEGLSDADRRDATALIAACRADLDVRLGNHDEALRRILTWLRRPDVDALVQLRLRRTHVGYLLAAARFDEVPELVAATRKELPLTAAERELFALYELAAQSARTDLSAADAIACAAQLQNLRTQSKQAYAQRWAAVLRAQLALRQEGDDATEAALAAARAACAGVHDTAAQQCIETTAAALLLRAHRRGAVVPDRLRQQRDAIENLWRQMREERADTPTRPSGVGFLHYAFRRDVQALRVGLALALDDSSAGRERAADMLLCGSGDAVTLQAVRAQALAGDDHGVLLYLPGGDFSYVFAIDRRRIEWALLASTPTLHARMREAEIAISGALALTESMADVDQEAEQRRWLREIELRVGALADELLPKAIRAAIQHWHRASLVGSEMLPTVPFECLPVDGEPLGHRIAVDRWPQVEFAVARATAKRRVGPLTASFFGKVTRSPADVGLAKAQVEPWFRDYAKAVTWCEEECTLEALRASSPVDLLVLLLHGERRADRVRSHGLRFDDGFLGCEEVANLPPCLGFVVIAACNAALGPNRFGEAMRADLSGAFLDRGATCVAASPFALRLAATRELLATAVPSLATGMAPAEALRRARVAMAKEAKTMQQQLDVWTTGALAVFGYGHLPLQ